MNVLEGAAVSAANGAATNGAAQGAAAAAPAAPAAQPAAAAAEQNQVTDANAATDPALQSQVSVYQEKRERGSGMEHNKLMRSILLSTNRPSRLPLSRAWARLSSPVRRQRKRHPT